MILFCYFLISAMAMVITSALNLEHRPPDDLLRAAGPVFLIGAAFGATIAALIPLYDRCVGEETTWKEVRDLLLVLPLGGGIAAMFLVALGRCYWQVFFTVAQG